MKLNDLFLPTVEVVEIVQRAMEAQGVSAYMMDLRIGFTTQGRYNSTVGTGYTRKLLKARYAVMNINTAERLLHAVGLDLYDCPTYSVLLEYNERVKREYREKTSKASLIREASFRGRKHSDESREKMRAAHQARRKALVERMPQSYDQQEVVHQHPVWDGVYR